MFSSIPFGNQDRYGIRMLFSSFIEEPTNFPDELYKLIPLSWTIENSFNFDWKEQCKWNEKVINSGRNQFDMSFGYEIFLKDYTKIDATVKELYELDDFPDTWDTISAKNISPNIFDWLNMQDKTRNVLIVIMLIVAIINLITCLIILVLERIKMVGVLKALGASDWTVQKIFLWHSSIITFTGIFFGLVFGLGILWLQQATGFIRLPEDAYYMDTAAVKIVWWQVAIICGGTLAVCFLVLMIPTFIVKRVQPVKAIQFR